MNPEVEKVRDVFIAALRIPPNLWESFLQEACGADQELRRQVEALLRRGVTSPS